MTRAGAGPSPVWACRSLLTDLELVGNHQSSHDQHASDVAQQIDVLSEHEISRHHRHQRLHVKIVVRRHRPERLHGFIPYKIGRDGAYQYEEKEVEQILGGGEIEKQVQVERLLLEKEQRHGGDHPVEEELAGDEQAVVQGKHPLDGHRIDRPAERGREGEQVACGTDLQAVAVAEDDARHAGESYHGADYHRRFHLLPVKHGHEQRCEDRGY